MSWVSHDKVVWLKKRGASKRFPYRFNFIELKLVLERDLEDSAKSKDDLGEEVANAISKLTKTSLMIWMLRSYSDLKLPLRRRKIVSKKLL